MTNITHPELKVSASPSQSQRMALVEAATNVIVGYALAVLVQLLAFPTFGIRLSLGENLVVGLIFTLVSVIRSYALRRLFERIRIVGLQRDAAALRRTAAKVGLWVGQLPMR